jgi:hypothetical protein
MDGGTEQFIGHYLPGNVVALLCCWKITTSVAVTVTLVLPCGCLRKESTAIYMGLCRIENLFLYNFSILFLYK